VKRFIRLRGKAGCPVKVTGHRCSFAFIAIMAILFLGISCSFCRELYVNVKNYGNLRQCPGLECAVVAKIPRYHPVLTNTMVPESKEPHWVYVSYCHPDGQRVSKGWMHSSILLDEDDTSDEVFEEVMRIYDRDFTSYSEVSRSSTKDLESSIRDVLKNFRLTRINVNPGMKPTYVGIWWHPKAQSWRDLRTKIDIDACMIAALVRDACTVPFRLEMAAVYPMEKNGEPIKVFQAEIDQSGMSKIVKSKLPERSSDYFDLFKERWYVPELR
jgi:hypothetical protein